MKVILFGATGMVGQGVLRECLRDEAVDSVLVKRETRNRMNRDSVSVPKSNRQRQRKNVDTVKGWVSEWERRKRQLQSAADALIAQCVVAARERRNRCGSELKTLITRPEMP